MSDDTVCLDSILNRKGLTREDLNRQIKSEHLNKIAVRIGDWKSCGAFLGIPIHDIEDIEYEEKRVRNMRIKLFSVWEEKQRDNATYLVLAKVLAELGHRDLIEQLIRMYQSVDRTSWGVTSYTRLTALTKKSLSICRAPFSILLKNIKLLSILFVVMPIITIATGTYWYATQNDTQYHSKHEDYFQPRATDLAELNKSRCDFVSHDLPLVTNSPFVGRHDEINRIVHYLHTNTAHIISINGAPGFGKSLLAIHVGYEMVNKGSTVRYIDAVEKLANSRYFSLDSEADQTEQHKHSGEEPFRQSNSKAASLKPSLSSEPLVMPKTTSGGEQSDIVLENLLTWSEGIQCHTVLILDNCDDLIYSDITRENLIHLIKRMVQKSKNQLHIIITSRQQLYILDDFDSLVVKELSKSASAELLTLLAPNISVSHAEEVAALVEGCPLALKVVGMLLHKQEDRLSEFLLKKLQQNPIQVLDKASARKERFGVIMDLVYEHLGSMQECGHYISLFPGSFSHEAGSHVVPSDKCLDSFVEQSLVEMFYVADQNMARYKMHRLIREYFLNREILKNNTTLQLKLDFETNYCNFFTNYILNYASLTYVSEKVIYLYSLEVHNIHHYLNILLPRVVHTTKELTVLAYAIGENLIPIHSVKEKFNLMVQNTDHICHFLEVNKCGELFLYIIRQLYHECRCTNTYEYFKQILHSPCLDSFQCPVVKEIYYNQSESIIKRLHEEEIHILSRILYVKCQSLMGRTVYYDSVNIPYVYVNACQYLLLLLLSCCIKINNFFLILLSIQSVIMSILLGYVYYFKWMVWLTDFFPFLPVCFMKFIQSSILYSQYSHRVVQLYNYIYPHYEYHSLVLFVKQRSRLLFTCLLVVNFIFDEFIFWKIVPICY